MPKWILFPCTEALFHTRKWFNPFHAVRAANFPIFFSEWLKVWWIIPWVFYFIGWEMRSFWLGYLFKWWWLGKVLLLWSEVRVKGMRQITFWFFCWPCCWSWWDQWFGEWTSDSSWWSLWCLTSLIYGPKFMTCVFWLNFFIQYTWFNLWVVRFFK